MPHPQLCTTSFLHLLPFNSMLIISCTLTVLLLQATLFIVFFAFQKEDHSTITQRQRDPINRLSDSSYDFFSPLLSETKQEECKTFITLSLIIYHEVIRPRLCKVSCAPPEWGGNDSWNTSLLGSSLHWLRMKTIFGSNILMFSAFSWDYLEILSYRFHVSHVHFLVYSHFLKMLFSLFLYF